MERTRSKYESDVQHLGKFEGESPICPYFYDMSMDGGADESFGATDFFIVSDDDRAFWAGSEHLDGVYGVSVTTLDNGFTVLTAYESESEYKAAADRTLDDAVSDYVDENDIDSDGYADTPDDAA